MRHSSLTVFIACLMTFCLKAQIIINEIMYNPPESGTDYLEYIEFYNSGNTAINLLNYSIPDAVVYTFPDTLIQPGSFIVLSVDSLKMDSVFGVKALKWISGGLRNTDEVISLLNAQGSLVDSVHYYSAWNALASGNGASLELCRPTADNSLQAYWRSSNSSTNTDINGKIVFASPGKQNQVMCAEHTIQVTDFMFNPNHLEIYVGDQIEWLNTKGTHNVNGSQVTFPANPESFLSGSPLPANWSFIHQFKKEGNYTYQCDPHASSGMSGTIRVKVRDVNYPDASIGALRSYNQNGILDSIDKRFSVEGTVYGVNLRPAGLQFTIIDPSGEGLGVFVSTGNKAYTVNESDVISVKGLLTQFNGLAQINADTILLLSTGATLLSPQTVTALDEETESSLIRIKAVSLVDPLTWTNNPLGFTTKITDGLQTFDLRIDNDVNVHGTMAPGGLFNVTGLGSQFDANSPYFEGYQIMPRYLKDIELINAVNEDIEDRTYIYPTLVNEELFISSSMPIEEIEILDAKGNYLSTTSYTNRLRVSLAPGIYFIHLKGHQSTFHKFIKL